MKKVLALGVSLALATAAFGQRKEINGQWYRLMPTNANAEAVSHEAGGGGGGAKLVYHNGEILQLAKVVPIFWGTYWSSGTGASQASSMRSFYETFGWSGEYNVITQYYDTVGSTHYIAKTALIPTGGGTAGTDYWYDGTNPGSTNVTDAMVRAEVNKALSSSVGVPFSDKTIYEVFIGPGYFSSNGTSGSCGATGGVSLAYCAYHGSYTSGSSTVKYSIEPYPSCSGCSTSGFSSVQNMQHFACHETREAVTDPVSGWWDNRGYEADDKCAWSPTPFTDSSNGVNTDGSAFAYQYEWSNANGGCVKTR
jgi:hypothetical protein